MKIINTLLISFFLTSNIFAIPLTDIQIKESYAKSYNYSQSANFTDAIKALQLVYGEYPKTYTVNFKLGSLYSQNYKYSNSIKHYKDALKIIPSAIEAKLGLQYTYLLSKDYDSVLKIGYQIISTDYYNYYGNYRLGYALMQLKKYDLAQTIFNKMLLIYPTDTLFLTELGLLYKLQNKLTEAKKVFASVLILDPENVRVKLALQNINE